MVRAIVNRSFRSIGRYSIVISISYQIQQKYGLGKELSYIPTEPKRHYSYRRRRIGNEELDSILLEAIEEAVISVKQMRELEGAALEKDLSINYISFKKKSRI